MAQKIKVWQQIYVGIVGPGGRCIFHVVPFLNDALPGAGHIF